MKALVSIPSYSCTTSKYFFTLPTTQSYGAWNMKRGYVTHKTNKIYLRLDIPLSIKFHWEVNHKIGHFLICKKIRFYWMKIHKKVLYHTQSEFIQIDCKSSEQSQISRLQWHIIYWLVQTTEAWLCGKIPQNT